MRDRIVLLVFYLFCVFGYTNASTLTIINKNKIVKHELNKGNNLVVTYNGKTIYSNNGNKNVVIKIVKPHVEKKYILKSDIINFNYKELAYPTNKISFNKENKKDYKPKKIKRYNDSQEKTPFIVAVLIFFGNAIYYNSLLIMAIVGIILLELIIFFIFKCLKVIKNIRFGTP